MIVPLLALVVSSTGCVALYERKFDITVENKSSRPVTLWLVKEGGVSRPSWRSPEEIALMAELPKDEKFGAVIVDPNKVGENQIEGKFESNSFGVLRIYDGELDMNQILARSPGVLRKDMTLFPGKNHFVIADAPILKVEQLEPKP